MAAFNALILFVISIVYFPEVSWGWYSTNTFKVSTWSENLVIPEGGIKNDRKDVYVIENFGRAPVWAVVQTKAWELGSFYDRAAEYVRPGERIDFDVPFTPRQNFYRLLIRNRGDVGTMVYASVNGAYDPHRSRNGGTFYLNIDANALLKSVATFGAGYIPVVGSALSAILDFFWPVASVDAWSQVSQQVESMIGEKVIELVGNLLANKVRRFKKRLFALNNEMMYRSGDGGDFYIKQHYLNLAQDVFGLEEDFVFDRSSEKNRKINYQLLPYYVKVVSLQMEVYLFARKNQKMMNLEDIAIQNLEMYRNAILFTPREGAIDYIYSLYSKHQRLIFDECPDAEEIYNCVANVRTYVTLNGLNYITLWIDRLDTYLMNVPTFACNPIFSRYLGRPSHQLHKYGSQRYEPDPLMPKNRHGSCSRMVNIIVYKCPNDLCGITTTFSDGKVYKMGQQSEKVTQLELTRRKLTKIEVYGSGVVYGLTFVFDDGEKVDCGSTNGHMGTFAVEDYYIAGILVTNGDRYAGTNNIANIAVSYLPIRR